jgi:hypothetical protein
MIASAMNITLMRLVLSRAAGGSSPAITAAMRTRSYSEVLKLHVSRFHELIFPILFLSHLTAKVSDSSFERLIAPPILSTEYISSRTITSPIGEKQQDIVFSRCLFTDITATAIVLGRSSIAVRQCSVVRSSVDNAFEAPNVTFESVAFDQLSGMITGRNALMNLDMVQTNLIACTEGKQSRLTDAGYTEVDSMNITESAFKYFHSGNSQGMHWKYVIASKCSGVEIFLDIQFNVDATYVVWNSFFSEVGGAVGKPDLPLFRFFGSTATFTLSAVCFDKCRELIVTEITWPQLDLFLINCFFDGRAEWPSYAKTQNCKTNVAVCPLYPQLTFTKVPEAKEMRYGVIAKETLVMKVRW